MAAREEPDRAHWGDAAAGCAPGVKSHHDADGNLRMRGDVYIDGPEIFLLSLSGCGPQGGAMNCCCAQARGLGDIDLYVFHQANQYMLEHLRRS